MSFYCIRKNIRRRFWDEGVSHRDYQSQYARESTMNSSHAPNEASKQYRQQYLNENSKKPGSHSSYIDSYDSDTRSSFDTSSMKTTRISLISPYSNSVLPDVEITSPIADSLQSSLSTQGRSILMEHFSKQVRQKQSSV